MFHPFAYDDKHRTYFARFSGTLTQQDLVACQAAVMACRTLNGPADGILDFSQVSLTSVTSNQLIEHGRRPQAMADQKCAIVANGVVFGMMRMFGLYRAGAGDGPMVVRTLPEACEALGLMASDFHPVELPARSQLPH